LAQIGRSQVPLRFVGTFQSQSRVAGAPHAHRWRFRLVQTMALTPPTVTR
jgi:hypothetical protein